MFRVRSVRPWIVPHTRGIGRIHGGIFLAYLDDRFRQIPFPLLHGMCLEWEPNRWLRLTGRRTILLGGLGRTEKLKARDVWDILLGRGENLVGERPISDTDQKASFGFEFRIPPEKLGWSGLDGIRLFFEYAGEDSFEGLLPTAVAHHRGGSVVLRGWTALVELAETVEDANFWYTWHNVYGTNPYFYRGYLLGHPMSGDARSGHLRIWSPGWRGYRAQLWFRRRGHWDRDSKSVTWWVDSGGFRVNRDVLPAMILDAGLELSRSTGDRCPLPDPPLHWRLSVALRTGRPPRGEPLHWNTGVR
jgi:hypothetical protein